MSQTQELEHIIVNSSDSTTHASVIWLHGLGADCHDFESIIPELNLPNNLGVRFIFPNAPTRSITINGGFPCRAWYDIISLTDIKREDSAGVIESKRAIDALIAQEIANGVPASRIILAGFSQGGAMALYTGLQYPEQLAGILALSCYLPLSTDFIDTAHHSNARTSILQMHGTKDDVLPLSLGERSFNYLSQHNYPISFKTFPMGHQLCPEQIQQISQWMIRRLIAC